MIRITRGKEPKALKAVRAKELPKLRAIATSRKLAGDDIVGYKCVSNELWQAQHLKCCYCEMDIAKGYNDVEHYRPKAEAIRTPGSAATDGYWWLAFTWSNLLFACPTCNRSEKNSAFPLDLHSPVLRPEQRAPGKEIALLLDPASDQTNPVEHIVHVLRSGRWNPEPRNGSMQGLWTITVCGLDRDELHELRTKHVTKTVMPHVYALQRHLASNNRTELEYEYARALGLLQPNLAHVALSYDVLRHCIKDAELQAVIKKTWPTPAQVGI